MGASLRHSSGETRHIVAFPSNRLMLLFSKSLVLLVIAERFMPVRNNVDRSDRAGGSASGVTLSTSCRPYTATDDQFSTYAKAAEILTRCGTSVRRRLLAFQQSHKGAANEPKSPRLHLDLVSFTDAGHQLGVGDGIKWRKWWMELCSFNRPNNVPCAIGQLAVIRDRGSYRLGEHGKLPRFCAKPFAQFADPPGAFEATFRVRLS